MLKYEDCVTLLSFAATMGREAAQCEDIQEALAKLQGAIVMFMMLKGISSSMSECIYDLVFDQYQDSFIAYILDKSRDRVE